MSTTGSLAGFASVRFSEVHKTPPTLLAGRITPSVLQDWQDYAEAFFAKVKIAEDDKVKSILSCFPDVRINNWINNNDDTLKTAGYTFIDFMTALRKRFLEPQWASAIMRSTVNSKMEKSDSFLVWANRVMKGNNLLKGTDVRLTKAQLRTTLQGNMSEFLASKIDRLEKDRRDRLDAIPDFEDWIDAIALIDDELRENLKHVIEMTTENVVPNRQQQSYVTSGANAVMPARNNGYRPPSNQVQSSRQLGSEPRCPRLTPEEIRLLDMHDGCRTCRQFYCGHRSMDCQKGFPLRAGYKTRTESMALAAKSNAAAIASTYGSYSVAASPSAFIDEVSASDVNSPLTSIAAVLPSSTQSFALGNGSVSGSESDVSPISVPHLRWEANVFGLEDFPIQLDCLLDTGAHLVLIRPETVADLQLPIRKLHKPERVTLAMNGANPTATTTVHFLSNYVSLSLSSTNNAWTSKPVRALIAPGLCTSVLLGLPFLAHNKIVIDPDGRTAIVRENGFDLMNPAKSSRKPFPIPLSPKHRRLVAPFDAISAIKNAIEVLASKDRLMDLETKIKADYREIFEPIPHINELPTSETARIQLIDAYKKISTRSYPCPRQFRESF
ncbi:hypothetical protein B0H34DRAFT_667072, partial [Crassisporium funariophilum]